MIIAWLKELFKSAPVCSHVDKKLKYSENGKWKKVDIGYWSDGSFRRKSEVLPMEAVFHYNEIYSREEMRSVKIFECFNCKEVIYEYSPFPLKRKPRKKESARWGPKV